MTRAWTLRGHFVDTSMDTLSPIPPIGVSMSTPPADGRHGASRRRKAVPVVAIRFRLRSSYTIEKGGWFL